MFTERLRKFREDMGITKTQMADKLGASEILYNQIKSGEKKPSHVFLLRLVNLTHLPEEYWTHGISLEEYHNVRQKYKSIDKTINVLKEMNQFNLDMINNLFSSVPLVRGSMEELFVQSLKSDLSYLAEDKSNNKNENQE